MDRHNHHQASRTTFGAWLDVDSVHSVEGGVADARGVTLLTKVMCEAVGGAGVNAGNTRCWIAAPVDALGHTSH